MKEKLMMSLMVFGLGSALFGTPTAKPGNENPNPEQPTCEGPTCEKPMPPCQGDTCKK
ncbi:MAG: hypothetical protein LW808_000920 [Verrucomicrobiota bacterium]|nr:MAG: hypothetical protein LW808_000920 [Verrucomicrobiota bacterium]